MVWYGLWKHSKIEHGGDLEEWDYAVKVVRKPKTPLERQILEGVLIEEEKLEEILNSKSEYGHNMIPRMRIEVGARVMRDDELLVFRKEKVREAMEEDEDWEKRQEGGLAGKRDGGRLEPSRGKKARLEVEEAVVGEENVVMGKIEVRGEGGGPTKRRFFSNYGTPTIGGKSSPQGIKRKLGQELPQEPEQIGAGAPPENQEEVQLGQELPPR